MDSGNDPFGLGHHGPDVCFLNRLRKGLTRTDMIYLAAIVTAFLFVYLMTALLRPEWF
jgi:K+-transporting ATPase KdpF subunit